MIIIFCVYHHMWFKTWWNKRDVIKCTSKKSDAPSKLLIEFDGSKNRLQVKQVGAPINVSYVCFLRYVVHGICVWFSGWAWFYKWVDQQRNEVHLKVNIHIVRGENVYLYLVKSYHFFVIKLFYPFS